MTPKAADLFSTAMMSPPGHHLGQIMSTGLLGYVIRHTLWLAVSQ